MDGSVTVALFTTGGAAFGALLQYITSQRTNAVNIEMTRRKDERDDEQQIIAYYQAELARVSAERDRYLSEWMSSIKAMNEASSALEQRAKGDP